MPWQWSNCLIQFVSVYCELYPTKGAVRALYPRRWENFEMSKRLCLRHDEFYDMNGFSQRTADDKPNATQKFWFANVFPLHLTGCVFMEPLWMVHQLWTLFNRSHFCCSYYEVSRATENRLVSRQISHVTVILHPVVLQIYARLSFGTDIIGLHVELIPQISDCGISQRATSTPRSPVDNGSSVVHICRTSMGSKTRSEWNGMSTVFSTMFNQ